MSSDLSGFDDYAYETLAGQCAIVAALVIALHENGVLAQGRYSDALQRLWMEMPEREAVGEAGAVIERLLDLLDARASSACPSGDAEMKPRVSAFAGRPANDDAVVRPVPAPLKALLHALCGAGPGPSGRSGRDRTSASQTESQ